MDPHMGSGSFLGRKTLVQTLDIFLTSPQFLHRAFLFRIKSISVNKGVRLVMNKVTLYRGTSLIRNSAPVGPYSRTMPRSLWSS